MGLNEIPQEQPLPPAVTASDVYLDPTMAPTSASATPDDRTWGMIAHLSAFVGFICPLGNIIAPFIIMITKGKESPFVERHAKESLNFQINFFVYAIVAILLCFVFIGFLILPVLSIAMIVFVVLAAIKANDGNDYQYPLTVRCVK